MTKQNCLLEEQFNELSCKKRKLFRSLVISILLYRYQRWTFTADTEHGIQAFEYKCYRGLIHISYGHHKIKDYVRKQVTTYIGSEGLFFIIAKCFKQAWHGHISHHNTLSKIILQWIVEDKEVRGRQKKPWVDNMKDLTSHRVSAFICTAALLRPSLDG